MNVFVLSTGRCGSKTFERACMHISNYTTAHESRVNQLGFERLNYPPNHIESDNRLSWFLGRLDRKFPNNVFYVHLVRKKDEVAASYAKRFGTGPDLIMNAYCGGIYIDLPRDKHIWALQIAQDYVDTVNSNIEFFLKNKQNKMTIHLETIKDDFQIFWDNIDARGDLGAAINEFDVHYNNSENSVLLPAPPLFSRGFAKCIRIIRKIPGFIRNA